MNVISQGNQEHCEHPLTKNCHALVRLTTCAEIEGESLVAQKLRSSAQYIAESPAPFLVHGVHGAGKKHFAHYVHQIRAPHTACFVLYGAAIANTQEDDIATALQSICTQMNECSIILDSPERMPISLQKHIETLCVSETPSKKIHLAITSTTSLEDEIEKNTFLSSLYHMTVSRKNYLPPLSTRPEDIHVLTETFLKEASIQSNTRAFVLSDEAKDLVLTYEWPRNIQELKITMYHANLLCANSNETSIRAHHIRIPQTTVVHCEEYGIADFHDVKNKFKKQYLLYALRAHKWNQTKTAAALSMQRSYLSSLVKILKISNNSNSEPL